MRNWGIKARILLLALAPASLMVLVLGSYVTYWRMEDMNEALRERGHAIARQLAEASEHAIYARDSAWLDELLSTALEEQDTRAVTVRDAAGAVLGSKSKSIGEASLPCDRAPARKRLCFFSPIGGSEILAQRYPDVATHDLGTVVIEMAPSSTTARQQRALLIALSFGALCLALAALAAWRLGRQVSDPICRLAVAVAKLGKGDFDVSVPVASGGELQTLEAGIKDMAEKLKQGQEQLERRVEEATRQLVEQKEEAERANLAKSRFLAAATHDLRQPMHALMLFVSALRERIHYPEVSQIVRNIESSVTAMQGMFNALLDISRLDAGVLQSNPRDFNLQPLLDRLSTAFSLNAAEKALKLRIVPSNAVVRTDPLLLERVLTNLVSNALRYTEHGGVLVACRRRGGALQIEVWDTGIGIPAERQQEVFQEFYQLNNPERDRSKGLGLGLAIVERIGKLLGTRVDLSSVEGRGSKFSIKVPRGNARRVVEEAPSIAVPPVAQRLQDAVIVFVDDEPTILEGMGTLLRDWGCRPITADSLAATLRHLETVERAPDLIISDYRLRERESGIDVIAAVRARYQREIPAILISGDTTPELLREVKDRGLQILPKPVRPAKLRAVLNHLIDRRETVA